MKLNGNKLIYAIMFDNVIYPTVLSCTLLSRWSKQHFINDKEKMFDFFLLSKEEFLSSYSYLSEVEYNNTVQLIKDYVINNDNTWEWLLED